MLQRFFNTPVELTIQDKAVLFNSLDEFEFALDARTAIPLDKITDTMQSSIGELQLELDAITVAREKLADLVSQSPETSSGLTMRLKSINSAIFSKDNGWRDIIIALNSNETFESCKYKQVALETYLQYLSNRLGMIKSIQHELEKNQAVDSSMQTTSSFELENESDATLHSSIKDMTSMPKGQPVILDIKVGDKVALLLSKYKCELRVSEDGIKFIDSNGNKYPINTGKNKIGRGQGCSVKFEEGMHEISRVHMMIVNHNDRKLELTDLSTHGTHYHHHIS